MTTTVPVVYDPFVSNDSEQHWIDLAEQLGRQFAPAAVASDRDNTFPAPNYDALARSGYSALTVPAQYGGGGGTLTETLLAQERLARHDGATALAIGWHLALLGKQAETRSWPESHFESVCRAVVRDGALINSAASERETGSPSRGGLPTTKARRTRDGWLLNGRKAFVSLAPMLTYAVVSASIDGAEPFAAGWFLVPLSYEGVTVDETWDALGMRATGSHDLVLDDVRLPADAFLQGIGPGRTCQIGSASEANRARTSVGDGAGWGLHIPAVYAGIAQGAQSFILRYARERRPNSLQSSIADVPQIQMLLGQSEADIMTVRSLLYNAARRWDEQPAERGLLRSLLGTAKVVTVNKAIAIVDRAMRIAGIAGLSRSLPLERYYRDVRAGLSNPPMEDSVLVGLAKDALQRSEDE